MDSMCPLCFSESVRGFVTPKDGGRYGLCLSCDFRFLDPSLRLNARDERERYLLHKEDRGDEGYRKFVTPLMNAILKHIPKAARGLDFGAGRIAVLASWLREFGYEIDIFDAYFAPDEKVFSRAYDFIVTCEVIEHLYQPLKDFERLRGCLKPQGQLFVQTELYREEILFDDWYYRRDPTHVGFYSSRTFAWLGDRLGFSGLEIEGRTARFFTKETL